ncbi:signal peptide peptidase SppA, partial [candidate division GN15 bacterium]|nr:signal peptide peptidase SppA [candidate division GN15 bacterium]
YDQFVAEIADGRDMSEDSVEALIDRGPFTSEAALRTGLVDGLSYRDQVKRQFLSSMPEISFSKYRADTLSNDDWPGPPEIGVVVAEGDITADGGADDPLGRAGGVTPSPMKRAFAEARTAPEIRGIVFRINSPGGSALAGEEIYRDVERAAEQKPMIVSMANVAASGGYYIATPARRMYVNPGTVTGSIGIYGGKLDLSGLYDKLDVGKELYTRGRFAGMMTNIRPFTEEERAKYMSHLEAFYGHFVDLVAESRGLETDSVNDLSQGKVWTGRQAVDNGLADVAGGLKAALDEAANQAGIKEYRIRLLPEKRPWLLLPGSSLVRRLLSFVGVGDAPNGDSALLPVLTEDEVLLARLPFDISIE